MSDEHEHSGPDCRQCQGMAEAAKIMGGFAEAMQKALDDGTFERLGAEMAMRREEAFWKAFLDADASQPDAERRR